MGRRQLTWYSTATCSGVNTSVGPIHLDSTVEQIAITCSRLLQGRTRTDEHLACGSSARWLFVSREPFTCLSVGSTKSVICFLLSILECQPLNRLRSRFWQEFGCAPKHKNRDPLTELRIWLLYPCITSESESESKSARPPPSVHPNTNTSLRVLSKPS